jgi:hypothetical protein
LQSRKGKGHVNIGASSQDCKVQGSNLDLPTQALVADIESYCVDQLY